MTMFKLGAEDALQNIKKKMRPGDILNTAPRSLDDILSKVYKPISRKVQGTDYGHSAIYEGRGRVIEARAGEPIKRVSLEDVARENRFKVLRLKKSSKKEKQDALHYARKSLGKPFSLSALTIGGLKPTSFSGGHEKARQKLNDIFCSSLIANAYPQQAFNQKRQISDTRPSDILRSRLVKRIGEIK